MKSKEQVFRPDKYRLDEEWEEQPDLMHEASDRSASAKASYKEAEAETKRVEAELKLRIRKDPRTYGFDKVTEDMVSSLAITQPEYRQAKAEEIRRQKLADEAQGDVRAMEHRKTALEELQSLFNTAYFARPRDRTTRHEAEAAADRAFGRKRQRNHEEED